MEGRKERKNEGRKKERKKEREKERRKEERKKDRQEGRKKERKTDRKEGSKKERKAERQKGREADRMQGKEGGSPDKLTLAASTLGHTVHFLGPSIRECLFLMPDECRCLYQLIPLTMRSQEFGDTAFDPQNV